MDIQVAIGLVIREIRDVRGLNQSAFDPFSREHISRLERGRNTPNIKTLEYICSVLKISLPALLIRAYLLMDREQTVESWKERIEKECLE